MISEAQVLAAVLMHVPPKVPGLHLFRQGVGMASHVSNQLPLLLNQALQSCLENRIVDATDDIREAMRTLDRMPKFRFGVPGMADVAGIYEPNGWRVEIECKRYGQNLSEKQHQWAGNILRWGGIYYLARPLIGESLDECAVRWAEDIEKLIKAKGMGR